MKQGFFAAAVMSLVFTYSISEAQTAHATKPKHPPGLRTDSSVVADTGAVKEIPARSSISPAKNGGVIAQDGGMNAYMKGPAGTSCSVTMKDGTVRSGVESWNSGSWGGSGGWTCCLSGTACNQNPKDPVKAPNVTNGSSDSVGPGKTGGTGTTPAAGTAPVNTKAGSDIK